MYDIFQKVLIACDNKNYLMAFDNKNYSYFESIKQIVPFLKISWDTAKSSKITEVPIA